ncbi:MAG: ABC transporter permease subunit [Gemmatimonadota bacterium]|nr:ABC transporter permease subunit [Gemmatimonadota bacterium]
MAQPNDANEEKPRSLPGITPAARTMDRLGRWVIAVGGVGVILVVLGILAFVLREAYPLFLSPAPATIVTSHTVDGGQDRAPLAAGADPYREVAYLVRPDGIDFIRLETGETILRERGNVFQDRRVASVHPSLMDGFLGLGTSDGRVAVARVNYRVTYPEGRRLVRPELEFHRDVALDPEGEPVTRVTYRTDGARRSTAAGITASGRLLVAGMTKKRSLLGGGKVETYVYDLTAEVDGAPTTVLVDGSGRRLLAGTDRGEVFCWDVTDVQAPPSLKQRFRASDLAITALAFVLGDVSVVVGDSGGHVSTWYPVRGPDSSVYASFRKIHVFRPHRTAVSAIAPSARDKQFLTGSAGGRLMLHHMTSAQTFFSLEVGSNVTGLTFAPKADGFLCLGGDGRLNHYRLSNPHPEVTLKTLFGRVWYEGYTEPEFVWQSTGGTDEFEPKLSIIPLAYGTAKGTFYAMFFALPLAVLAAIYTSEFAHAKVRNVVKPTVELMASLPSVILGFLGGLWLAPLLEREVVGVLLLLPVVALTIISASWIWSRLPGRVKSRLPGPEAFYVAVSLLGIWLALAIGPWMEGAFWDGDFQRWLADSADTRYDQRNCLVVGFAMGFAVIPIIYTICEDALTSVPSHLRAGSLALGATPWQTAVRVVLPTASPGIFSATMIGFGRAVGETMIVLMATGNTPIMDWSVFNGMRTMSANIAVEIPEAPHEGTLYRVLFLTGVLLAGVTFIVNTLAEIVRQRLRERYSSI